MKKYNELNSLQKDFAVDKALETLVNILVEECFDYKFYSPIAQKHFLDAFKFPRSEFRHVLASDEIAEELYPIAESLAENSYYPEAGEYTFAGIVD